MNKSYYNVKEFLEDNFLIPEYGNWLMIIHTYVLYVYLSFSSQKKIHMITLSSIEDLVDIYLYIK